MNISGTRVYYPEVLLDTDSPKANKLNFNRWEGVRTQAGDYTRWGIKSLVGRSWSFYDVVIWDLGRTSRGVSAVISNRAEATSILGGNLTAKDFQDRGTETLVIDRFAGSSSP